MSLASTQAALKDAESRLQSTTSALSVASLKLQNQEDDRQLVASLTAKVQAAEKQREKITAALQKAVEVEREGRSRERDEFIRRIQDLEATLDRRKL